MDFAAFDDRPIIVAVAGPNGAGKSTFYHAHLRQTALLFIDADTLGRELNLEPYVAANVADALRRELVRRRESFIFETVFSDPVGDKLSFLQEAVESGYTVVLCFIGIAGPDVSEERVAMRVAQGGHDVPTEKPRSRFPPLTNLKAALRRLPHILIYSNDDLGVPFRLVAVFERGRLITTDQTIPRWLKQLLR